MTHLLTDQFGAVLAFAERVHRTQMRTGTTIPYVAPLLAVAALVLEHGGGEDQAIAGLLHDVVEDQGGAAAASEIRARFGPRVADIVHACTDADAIPKPPWRARKDAYIASIATKTDDAILVTTADKLHNATAILEDYRTLGERLWPRFTGGRDGTLWYYRALADAVVARSPGRLSFRLARAVEDLETAGVPARVRLPALRPGTCREAREGTPRSVRARSPGSPHEAIVRGRQTPLTRCLAGTTM